MATIRQKITPFLWFDNNAEEAANYYVSIFRNGKLKQVDRYDDAGPGQKGQVMVVEFELFGQEFVALNGGPMFSFNEAVSFVINCEGQEEVDYFWSKLTADGGQESMCGWLKDKYGLSWQVVPVELNRMLTDQDKAKANRAMQAMLKMKKIDLKKMREAFEGR